MILKYEQIILHIKKSVREGRLKMGDPLPSINSICTQFKTARETVVKAYKLLKNEELIESKPGKGFFLIKETVDYKPSIFLLLNSFNPYMEVLYNAFKKELKDDYNLDVYFHHHNIDVFRSLIAQNKGKYQSYVIKPFLNKEIPSILNNLKDEYLMIIDRQEYIKPEYSYICQDFSNGFYSGLESIIDRIRTYSSINYIHSENNTHPLESEVSFIKFSRAYSLKNSLIKNFTGNCLKKGSAYIVLADEDMIQILQVCRNNNWIPGKDLGIISYNDTPMNEFISGGITAISTDFTQMGKEASIYAKNRSHIRKINGTQLILRRSI